MWILITLSLMSNGIWEIQSVEQFDKDCSQYHAPYDNYHSEISYCINLQGESK